MVISDELSRPIIIDSIEKPISTEYFWTLNLENLDFQLENLDFLEEHTWANTGGTLVLKIRGYIVEAPAKWNMLIYCEETSTLDTIEIMKLTKGDYCALTYDHRNDRVEPGHVKVVDYNISNTIHFPSINKRQMLCHHVGPHHWCAISPVDSYKRYLKNKTIGELF